MKVGHVTESIGIFSSATASGSSATYGKTLSSSITKAFDVCADDGGTALTAGAYRAVRNRLLLTAAVSAGDISAYGHQGQLKITADESAATGILGGEWGYVELASGGNVNVAGGIVAHVDCPSGATITGVLAGLIIKTNDLGGTHTGKASMVYMPNEGAGSWDYCLDFATGVAVAAANTHTIDSHALAFIVKCR